MILKSIYASSFSRDICFVSGTEALFSAFSISVLLKVCTFRQEFVTFFFSLFCEHLYPGTGVNTHETG